MAALTKSDLVRINTQLGTDNAALRKQVEDLKLELAMHNAPSHRVAQHMQPQWQIDRAAAMAAAREMAMKTRFVVKVGG